MRLLLKKINRGAALMLVLVLAVTAYLIIEGKANNSEKPGIEKLCKDFFEDYTVLSMLPEKYIGETADQKQFNEYLEKTEEKILKYFIGKPEKLSRLAMEPIENGLSAQFSSGVALNDLERKIKAFESYIFEKDFVTVDVRSEIKFTSPSSKSGGTGMKTQTDVVDTILLQKTGEGWKIVSASISDIYNQYGQYNEYDIIRKEQTIPY